MGLMCACFPTLASLRQPRRSRRPVQNVLPGTMNLRHKGYKQSGGLSVTTDRHDPDEPATLGLEQLSKPSAAVVTKITRGSASESEHGLMEDRQDPAFTESGEEIDKANAIITTVRMEHSYC